MTHTDLSYSVVIYKLTDGIFKPSGCGDAPIFVS
jgi:hypothetical protein